MDLMPRAAEREGRGQADAGAAPGDEDGCHGETLRVDGLARVTDAFGKRRRSSLLCRPGSVNSEPGAATLTTERRNDGTTFSPGTFAGSGYNPSRRTRARAVYSSKCDSSSHWLPPW